MGFLQPNLPVVDHDVWDHQSRQERIRPMARHFAEHGFGSPDVVILMYLVKMLVFVAIGWAFIMTTPGINGWFDPGSWWRAPEAFYKFALWTMLFEVLGLGCGFGPLNLRFIPPMGSPLYWLRPGTIRLPPFRGRIPLTGGDTRTIVDVVLYAGLLISTVVALVGALTRWEVATVLAFLLLIGLRDQVIFLAARGEVYGTLALTFLFATTDQLTAAKFVMVAIWWGAATSKINHHFPFVMAAMQSNSPLWRFGGIKRRFHRDFPDDLRPSPLAATVAHAATVVEFAVPAVLLLSGGGWVTTTAGIVMILFHLGIISSFPMGVPLEWNVFMIWGVIFLFLAHPGLDLGSLAQPLLILALMAVVVGIVVYGNLVPAKVSFLPSMRYYAGNWAATFWCFKGDSLERLDANVEKVSMLPHQQLEKVYGSAQEASVPLFMGYAFRGFHTHGRALWTLVPRACGSDHEDFLVLDGELVAGTVLGWNFGDGHLHDEQLIAALQRRCDFRPGDVRIVFLESQPFHRGTQEYRLIDAATGLIETGHVEVADMIVRQPTDADLPLHPHPRPSAPA
ncbi:DUF3556 domain-containing protein [Dermatobacter hominis]|uniref:DUF3556 domain-containing protein n=1 Tax=Dermatobacter hominis TaxID=2884263 RepID=UPI001D119DC3|nr:DUF3556 domain-containing protein [Dermatobacter hominis]UDY35184.1 DUF3556 domain-containing protein [Dermatobacter hominis]